jgi:hypothetical protein
MISLLRSLTCFPKGPAPVLRTYGYHTIMQFVELGTGRVVMKSIDRIRKRTYFVFVPLEEFVESQTSPGFVDEPE